MTVPKGFTGPIWIMLDESAPEIPLVEGRYRVIIPVSGVLRVRSFAPFTRWHSFTAKYDDGSPIPYESGSSKLDPETIALRSGGMGATVWKGREYRRVKYFVGPQKEASDFLSNIQRPPGADK
jgi:hypothetical protein